MKTPTLALATVLALAGCTLPPPPPSASLPFDAVAGAGDPLRSAVINTGSVFSSPRPLAGRPGQAAQAVAQMEFLAVEMPNNPRFTSAGATVGPQFARARQEWRSALGIPAEMPAQVVIDSLFAASRALRDGSPDAAAAALPRDAFPQGGETALLRLASLPDLPLTNAAAVGAAEVLRRHQGLGNGRF
jgi:hypothetical protein